MNEEAKTRARNTSGAVITQRETRVFLQVQEQETGGASDDGPGGNGGFYGGWSSGWRHVGGVCGSNRGRQAILVLTTYRRTKKSGYYSRGARESHTLAVQLQALSASLSAIYY